MYALNLSMWFNGSLRLALFDQVHFCKTDVLYPIESLIPIFTFVYKKTCFVLLNLHVGELHIDAGFCVVPA